MWGRAPHIFLFWYPLSDPEHVLTNQQLEHLVQQVLDTEGFDLVELRRGGTATRPVLDVRVDRRDGQPVTVGDCARVSRALEARLDADGVMGAQYVLEVSSPGVERPLRRPGDWRRFAGARARVKSARLDGWREVRIVGVEGEPGTEVAVVRAADDGEHRLPLGEIDEARLVFEWQR